MQQIRVRGARTHNLKNLNLELPRERLIVVTGLSGSGKSSLTFDTLYAEGQRRYVESLSAYARQFLSTMDKPDVDSIEGLSPAIAIEQKANSHNPRSTVGTVTEIYDYLRLLYARAGIPRCPDHGIDLTAQTVSQMVDQVLKLPEGTAAVLLAPVVSERKGEHARAARGPGGPGLRARAHRRAHPRDGRAAAAGRQEEAQHRGGGRSHARAARRCAAPGRIVRDGAAALRRRGAARLPRCARARGAGVLQPSRLPGVRLQRADRWNRSCSPSTTPPAPAPAATASGVQEFFDRAARGDASAPVAGRRRGARLGPAQRALLPAHPVTRAALRFDIETPWTELPAQVQQVLLHGSGSEEIEFSYRHEAGRKSRKRHPFEGILPNLTRRYRETESPMVREELSRYLGMRPCPECHGTRLNRAARYVFVADQQPAADRAPDRGARAGVLQHARAAGLARRGRRARSCKSVIERLRFLSDVGLDYLTLDRSAETLSGGESQRIRLASQVGSGLTGVMYILDEPSIGLHQRDNRRLLATLKQLRDLGNTVIVVEHDEEAIDAADHVVDLGPGAGVHGGHLVAQGTPADIKASAASITGQYLSGKRRIAVPSLRMRPDPQRQITIVGASGNNLRQVTAQIPLGLFTCVTGVSGSGKSTLVIDTLFAPHRRAPERRARGGGAVRAHRRPGADRSRDRHRPESHRAHAALQSRHLHRPVRAAARAVRRRARGARARLRRRALQLQRQGRPLRGLPGRWRHPRRDALPAGRVRAVRCVQGPALQPRDARDPLPRQEHPRGAGDDRGGSRALLPERAGGRRQAADPHRRGTCRTCAWGRTRPRCPAAKRSA